MRGRVLSCVALLAALLSGCGDKGPSRQDFLAKADPLCKHGNEIAVVFTTPSDLTMIGEFTGKLADNEQKTVASLEKLKFPKGKDGDAAKAFVAAMKDTTAKARAVSPSVSGADYSAIQTGVDALVQSAKAADDKARSFGSTECGKGEAMATGNLTTVAPGVVKAAFTARADAFCKQASDELEQLGEPKSVAQAKATLEKLQSIMSKLVTDIRALPAPSTDKPKLDEALAAFDASLAKLREAQTALDASQVKKMLELLNEFYELTDTANAKADAYGFKDCGSQGT